MNTNALMDAALDCARRGWHVFPLRPGDKRPAVPDHNQTECTGRDPRCRNAGQHLGWEPRATTDPNRIRRAWSVAPYNIGIACGPSGLVVVDLDTPKPGDTPAVSDPPVRDGMDVFALLCAANTYDGSPELFTTHTVRTGRDGTHLYYRHPDREPLLRNTAGTLGWLVDTRAHGGYVVAAGSIVNARPYTTFRDAEPVMLPDWLADRLTTRPIPDQEPVEISLGTGRRAAYLEAAIRGQVDAITRAPGGKRNTAVYNSAVALGQLVAGGELTADEVTGLLTQAALSVGQRPTETAHTIASGLRAGANRPRSVAA